MKILVLIITLSNVIFAEKKEIKLPDFKDVKQRKTLSEKMEVTSQCGGVTVSGSAPSEKALKNCGGERSIPQPPMVSPNGQKLGSPSTEVHSFSTKIWESKKN